MEYSCKNSPKDEQMALVLGDYSLIFRKGETEEVIAYANILSLRINKLSGKVYRMHLYPDGHRPIIISNQCFDKSGKLVDQSREYSLLVRVLHHHLKDKSKSVFSCGGNSEKIWQLIGISTIFFFLGSLLANYWSISLFNPYIQGSVLSGVAAAIIITLNARNLPKTYQPTEVPIQFLP
ncbi:MAG: hypothetical protein HOP08_11655 [Cyclobacteriaceae bacterium]|nr:hypothetical protein [Cyclobacteriaceae bacterium]